jgi:predicted DNA-binding transcriptional regulator AlpA
MTAALRIPEVARELGHGPEWFHRNKKRLIERHGFPPPLAGCGNVWDPEAIEAWKRAQRPGLAPAAAPADEDAAWRAKLMARLPQVAAAVAGEAA